MRGLRRCRDGRCRFQTSISLRRVHAYEDLGGAFLDRLHASPSGAHSAPAVEELTQALGTLPSRVGTLTTAAGTLPLAVGILYISLWEPSQPRGEASPRCTQAFPRRAHGRRDRLRTRISSPSIHIGRVSTALDRSSLCVNDLALETALRSTIWM